MSGTRALAIIALTWVIIGVLVSVFMRRRGHDFWTWFALGAVLGPLALPLAFERARFHPVDRRFAPKTTKAAGTLDVLAGIDGSAESIAAVQCALGLFDDSVTSLTLATVVDFDAAGSYTGEETREEAEKLLLRAVLDIEFEPVTTTLLFGRPDQALAEYAAERELELIVVGARGHGISEALFGSVTARLVGGAEVPVFVGPRAEVEAEPA